MMDFCASLFNVYKIETIGDSYMVVGGIPEPDEHHASEVARFSLLVIRSDIHYLTNVTDRLFTYN